MSDSDYHFKKITDPIHGNIGLSRIESDIVSSRVFQRLHNVRQLGLAHLVYPGANYSRFAHSIGACHNASRMISSIQRNSGKYFDVQKVQIYRIVGLLHDIGHYPFSHTTENLIEKYYISGLIEEVGNSKELNKVAVSFEPSVPVYYDHESVGELIIRHDKELGNIFRTYGIEPDAVADLFAGKNPDALMGVISSDLDCDRLDYLRRTAHYSGAPYGSVDIDFIIDQSTVDPNGRYCLLPKAVRAADHLLVSRYYDYMQVPYNKTVAALEWSLTAGLEALLDRGDLNCSGQAVFSQVNNQQWRDFDDQFVYEKFKKLSGQVSGLQDVKSRVLNDHLQCILTAYPVRSGSNHS